MKKYCEEGNHLVEKLWLAKRKDRKSACKDCANKQPKPKEGGIYKKTEYKVTDKGWSKLTSKFRIVSISPSNTKPNQSDTKKEKSLPELLKLATIVFNRWIRKRDSKQDYLTCISCGKPSLTIFSDCGHYMPSNYSELRFNELNCNAECVSCNRNDPNHLIGYRKNLITKIGLEKVLWLESHKIAQEYKWSRQELLDIVTKYK